MVEDLLRELAKDEQARQYLNQLFRFFDDCSEDCRVCVAAVLSYYNLKMYFTRKINKEEIIKSIEGCKGR